MQVHVSLVHFYCCLPTAVTYSSILQRNDNVVHGEEKLQRRIHGNLRGELLEFPKGIAKEKSGWGGRWTSGCHTLNCTLLLNVHISGQHFSHQKNESGAISWFIQERMTKQAAAPSSESFVCVSFAGNVCEWEIGRNVLAVLHFLLLRIV